MPAKLSPQLREVRRRARQRESLESIFRDTILKAHASGESLRAIGEAAGLSHVRILQIVREGGE